MALKKSYSATYDKLGNEIRPQRDIDMHTLEEAEIRADWAANELRKKLPIKPSLKQEHEWMIEHGAEYIKQKRSEWQAAHDAMQPELNAAIAAHQEANKQWNDHAAKAVANGHDPDTHPDARNLSLPIKEIKS